MTVVRKSFDGRWKKAGQPKFVYTVDVSLTKEQSRLIKIVPKEGRQEPLLATSFSGSAAQSPDGATYNRRVVIIGEANACNRAIYCIMRMYVRMYVCASVCIIYYAKVVL